MPVFSYLSLLRNHIDVTHVPFSDRGSRLLVFQKPHHPRADLSVQLFDDTQHIALRPGRAGVEEKVGRGQGVKARGVVGSPGATADPAPAARSGYSLPRPEVARASSAGRFPGSSFRSLSASSSTVEKLPSLSFS